MHDLALQSPWWLVTLAIVPVFVWLRRQRLLPAFIIPYASSWWRPVLVPASRVPAMLFILALVLLMLALAGPRRMEVRTESRQEGYDIILAIDLSASMLAEDYEKDGVRLNRLQAIKPIIKAFIDNRPNDRIGLVVFAGRAYTLAPLTFDHDWLARQTEKLKIGMMEDGTAIGDGIGVALTRLEPAERDKSKKRQSAFIVLLTDGSNNAGTLRPNPAAEIARDRGIPIYTIAAGRAGSAPYPIFDETGKITGYRRIITDIDEEALKEIAQSTRGKYFRADNTATIENAFKVIDAAQKTHFESKTLHPRELFPWLIGGAFGLFTAGALVAYTPWRKESTS